MAAALDKMIKDGLDVTETSLEFDFGGQISTKPWPPGQKLMEYIKNVGKFFKRNGMETNISYEMIYNYQGI